MEELISFEFPLKQPILFSIVGIGIKANRAMYYLRQEKLEAVYFWETSTEHEDISEYRDIMKQLADETKFSTPIMILIADLDEEINKERIVSFIQEARTAGQLVVLVTTSPCNYQVDMLVKIDKETIYHHLPPCSELNLQENVECILRQIVKDFVETLTVTGNVILTFKDLQYFLKHPSQSTLYLSGYGTGKDRLQKAFEEILHNSVPFTSSDLFSFTHLYFIIQSGNTHNSLKIEEMGALTDFIALFKNECVIQWGMQCKVELHDDIRVFMFAKT